MYQSLNNKYSPKTLDECYVDQDIKNKFHKLINNNTLQNMIVYGIHYTCKTSFVNVIINEYYKNIPNKQDYYYYINPLSDKNKNIKSIIDVFHKNIIKDYNPQYKKIIIIDDINYVKPKIQHQISTFLTLYSNIIFFIISTDISETNEKIQSPCMIIHLEKRTKEEYIKYINYVCVSEHIPITNDVINQLYILSDGDIRYTLNQVQALYTCFQNLTLENFSRIYKIPDQILITELINLCLNKEIGKVILKCDELYKSNFSCNDILSGMFNAMIEYDVNNNININVNVKFSEYKRITFMYILGKKIYMTNKIIESILQLEECLIKLCNV